MQQEKVKEALEKFSKRVITQSRSNLTRMKKNASGKGYESLQSDLTVNPNSFSMAFLMEEYMQYQDQGVKGFKSTYPSASKSPFQYKGGKKLAEGEEGEIQKGINKWIRQKGIKGRDKKGRFITNKSLSYLIARSIFNKGIKGSMFFTRPFEQNFNKLPDELIEAFGLDIENFLNFTNGNNIR